MTLVLDPDLTSEKQKKLTEKIEKIISDYQGKVIKANEWGRKELAYPILKKNSGFYFFIDLEFPPEASINIEKKLRTEEGIIRFLLVKKEKVSNLLKKREKRKNPSRRVLKR